MLKNLSMRVLNNQHNQNNLMPINKFVQNLLVKPSTLVRLPHMNSDYSDAKQLPNVQK